VANSGSGEECATASGASGRCPEPRWQGQGSCRTDGLSSALDYGTHCATVSPTCTGRTDGRSSAFAYGDFGIFRSPEARAQKSWQNLAVQG